MKSKIILACLILISGFLQAQSIARKWNEEVLNGIRNDFARPTVHARNLFHTSVAMYDIWAVFDNNATPFLIGKSRGDFTSTFQGFIPNESIAAARKKAISYAIYRIMDHRFEFSPGRMEIMASINTLMNELGYDTNETSINYQNGNAAALGNFVAQEIIEFGLQDGSNEALGYENQFYTPLNSPLNLDVSGNSEMTHPNNWQPLKFEIFIDQAGNVVPGGQPDFLGPEWGKVYPFSLTEEFKNEYLVADNSYTVYHDPGPPSYIQEGLGISDPYKWGFSLVASWGSHLDPEDDVLIDISPGSIGNLNINTFPESFEEYISFYEFMEGGDPSTGWDLNPATGLPYEPNIVPRGDYARVLAEFWADGPDSETPPGHWFTILNHVNDHPELIKKFEGKGEELSDLEWDVKSYFILGGTMHDAAISAWGIKGYYDYVRPISAIRFMGDQGQSSDPNAMSYHPYGLPLVEGRIELVEEGDPLAGSFNEHVGKIKLYTWKGPEYIDDPELDVAGVDWILSEEWFPYQRPSFVTPPFAGYVSGHSTFSRAAAEVLTKLTGDPFFPGGMGTFDITANEFLVFERGPSVNMQLQWATYQDASDQTSLSRIWGGIHPPIDDIPGRIIGEKVGKRAFDFATTFFYNTQINEGVFYPNPATETITVLYNTNADQIVVFDVIGKKVLEQEAVFGVDNRCTVSVASLKPGVYFVALLENDQSVWVKKMIKQ